ncbi:hypothetical protein DVH24_024906 [Malus domestica]|uniref:Uncharacterized protein n=1 Tax=Malus domestica TaxID=3750 RepID=A0A498JNR7_MALDO|nr:hypothetical protein DVH24_024906 [Malus domestica]
MAIILLSEASKSFSVNSTISTTSSSSSRLRSSPWEIGEECNVVLIRVALCSSIESNPPASFVPSQNRETELEIMPKNKSNGGKNRKRGKNEADEEKRELVFKKDGQLLRMLDDIIFAGLRDCQDDKADVLLKYMPDEARRLKAFGELPENTRLNEDENEGGADDYVEFQDEDNEDIGIKYTRFSDQNSIHLLKDVIFYRF